MINPDQHARMQLEPDAHFQSMYPLPSGPHLFTSTGPVRPSDETQALHDEITPSLETTSYKTDFAAAATKAWDMMREAEAGRPEDRQECGGQDTWAPKTRGGRTRANSLSTAI